MCEVTEGRTVPCDGPGGAALAYILSVKDSAGLSNYLTGPTIAAGAITAWTLKVGKFAYPIYVEPETIEATCDSIGESGKQSAAFEMKTIIQLSGNTAEDIDLAERITKGRSALALKLNDGTYEVYHYENGAKCKRSRTPGKAMDDMNGQTWEFTSRQTRPEMKVSSAIINAMLEP